MAHKRILLAGESWVSATTHIKGYDLFPGSYEEFLEKTGKNDKR